jgi:hypothetical protein
MTLVARDAREYPYPALGQGTVTNLSFTGTAATMSNPVSATSSSVTLTATADCWFLISDAGTAATTANAELLPAGVKWCRRTNRGTSKVSAIQVSASGTLNVVEDA